MSPQVPLLFTLIQLEEKDLFKIDHEDLETGIGRRRQYHDGIDGARGQAVCRNQAAPH